MNGAPLVLILFTFYNQSEFTVRNQTMWSFFESLNWQPAPLGRDLFAPYMGAIYVLSALILFALCRKSTGERQPWFGLAIFLFVLGINQQFWLDWLLAEIVRGVLRAFELYKTLKVYRLHALITIGGCGGLLLTWLIGPRSHYSFSGKLATGFACLLGFYVILRAFFFHDFDRFNAGETLLPLIPRYRLFEFCGLLPILLSFFWQIRRARL